MKFTFLILLAGLLCQFNTFAQSKDSLTVQLYTEAYATIVDSKPPAERRSGFIYNYPRQTQPESTLP